MQIPTTWRVVCAATLCLASAPVRAADDSVQTNAPASSQINTNETPAVQAQKPLSKAELKKQAAEKKKAEKAAKAEAEKKAKAEKQQQAAAKPAGKSTAATGTNQPPKIKGTLTLKPIEGPPLPLSADKQQRLAELLQKYKADQITPEQYHTERAKILAEP